MFRVRLAKIRKRDIVALCIFLVCLYYIVRITQGGFYYLSRHDLKICTDRILSYMNDNDGRLPADKKVLDEIFLLDKDRRPGFVIKTDFDVNDIREDFDQLISRKTGKQVFIINGPKCFLIKREHTRLYEIASLRIFLEMKAYRKIKTASVIKDWKTDEMI